MWLSNKLHSAFLCLKFSLDSVGIFEGLKQKSQKQAETKLERASVCSA